MSVMCWLLLIQLVLLLPYTVGKFNRIVGGAKVPIEKCPYQLSLRLNGNPICGGALISENTGLTAAHCIPKRGSYSVRAGSAYIDKGGYITYVKQAIIHPGYRTSNQDFDIAILKFFEPLRYSDKIKPVKLPEQDAQLKSGYGFVSGWGSISSYYPFIPVVLRGTLVPLVPMRTCRDSYRFIIGITPRMFCAGFKTGGKDSCQGDSGGPFVVNNTLYGLVSWGFSCAQPGYPGVYTNISAIRDYIKANVEV